MGNLEGKVAFVTGAARGQGRAHAKRLAQEGADIIALDICGPINSSTVPSASREDLEQTVKEVEALDRRIVTVEGDVRDQHSLDEAVELGMREFGRLDIVIANAGLLSYGNAWEMTDEVWIDMVDINLNGVWRTIKSAVQPMIDGGRGGSIIMTSSVYGLSGAPTVAHYTASKHGVVGLMKSLAMELAQYSIRVNTINPTFVNTDMIHNEALYKQFLPNLATPGRAEFTSVAGSLNLLPTTWVEPEDIANAAAWLSSDQARYITGVSLPVDAGFLLQRNAIVPAHLQ